MAHEIAGFYRSGCAKSQAIDDRVVNIVFAEDGRTLVGYSVGTRVLAGISWDHTTFCDVLRHVIATLEGGAHAVD